MYVTFNDLRSQTSYKISLFIILAIIQNFKETIIKEKVCAF